MSHKHSLIREVISEAWCITEDAALSYSPIIQRLLNGESVDLSDAQPKAELTGYSDSRTDKVVAVLPIQGVITKNDYCGEMGTISMDRKLKEFNQDDSVGAVILDMDTPGGSAAFLQNISETIQNMDKPVLVHCSSLLASAGVYIASNAYKIFASTKADKIGSIGTMIQFYGPNPKKEVDSNYVIHTIYATKSKDKNKPVEEAIKGKYDLIKSDLLDPLNEFFIETVKEGRPDVDESVFTGKTYFANEAIQLGLIDGIKSFDEVVEYAFELINSNDMKITQLFNKNKRESMSKLERISAILNREVKEGDQLSAQDLAAVEAAFAENSDANTGDDDGEENNGSNSGAENNNSSESGNNESLASLIAGAVSSAMNPVNQTLSSIEARLAKVEGSAGGSASTVTPGAAQTAEGKNVPAYQDKNHQVNQEMNDLLDQHGIK